MVNLLIISSLIMGNLIIFLLVRFVLSSDQKLHYYKFENGQCQGTIDVQNVFEVQYTDSPRDTNFTLVEDGRVWSLSAPNEVEKNIWVDVLTSLVNSRASDGATR